MIRLLTLGTALALCAATPSQNPLSPPRTVIHLWVDPHHGNDAGAAANNPNLAVGNQQLPPVPGPQLWPVDHFNPALNSVLLHAPWPFKTITGALAYIAPITPLRTQAPSRT